MATIAEIIAAKAAKASAEKPAQEAIDRIDPPKKRTPFAGLVLNRDMPCKPEPRGQQTPILPPDEPAPRNLAEFSGETLPLTPTDAPEAVARWHAVLESFETDLCLMRDPSDPEVCWLALRNTSTQLPPALLHRLPWLLWEHPRTERPPSQPF